MAKPRTNADACRYWAESICEREPRADIDVNSIMVRRDVVYSFGRHYPMGVIERREDGRVRRVVLNSDSYPKRGFADTSGDQWSVRIAAEEFAAKARVPVLRLPLSAYSTQGRIQCRPKAHDPEPEAFPRTIVPLYFDAVRPGKEPWHDRTNCVAGRVEEYEYQEDHYMLANLELYADDQVYTVKAFNAPQPGDFLLRTYGASGTGGAIYARRAYTGTIVWGEEEYNYQHFGHGSTPAGVTYKQCPCCAKFKAEHRRWYVYMHGGWELGPGGHRKGWLKHEALMREHGGEEGWRQARREDLRRVRRAKKDRAEWEDRNFMPLDSVPRQRVHGSDNTLLRTIIPVLDANGYPLRKDSEVWFKLRRDRERAKRRLAREEEERMRERMRVEKFKAMVERRRAHRRARTFEGAADNAARVLASLTNRLES